ncbi:MAG: hypothetical protein LBI04_05040 [Treponema sp.]|jgi:hypothetical protein|nr:hypothetical protein [Treponema sp.]
MKDAVILKNKAIIFGWVIGLLFFISLLWVLSQPLQKYYLLRTINNVLISSGDSRRIAEYKGVNDGKAGIFGYWFLMDNSAEKMFVFAAFQDGILVPLGAIVSANGSVDDIIPLSAHAMQIAGNLPMSLLQVYITRIEAASLANIRGNK